VVGDQNNKNGSGISPAERRVTNMHGMESKKKSGQESDPLIEQYGALFPHPIDGSQPQNKNGQSQSPGTVSENDPHKLHEQGIQDMIVGGSESREGMPKGTVLDIKNKT
jgi:hypothetical protein